MCMQAHLSVQVATPVLITVIDAWMPNISRKIPFSNFKDAATEVW